MIITASLLLCALSGPILPPGRWMQVQASAYCPCQVCCGSRAAGLTATGADVRTVPYGVATHPRFLPYGSHIWIPAGQGYLDRTRHMESRIFQADDTGGIIRSRTETTDDVWIDLRFKDHSSAKRFGIKSIRIYVIDGDEQ